MLELSLPPPMPHAVGLDKPFHSLTLQPPRAKHDQQYYSLPPPRGFPPVELRPSASSDMATSQVGFGVPQPSVAVNGVVGHAPNVSSRQPPPYSNSLPPPYPASSQKPASSVPQQPPAYSNSHRRKQSSNAVAPSLQIPKSVNAPQLSVPQLAAEITCLFWFENSSLLQQIEDSVTGMLPRGPLAPDAIPTTGFRKWVATILSTTQVAQNVIILALLFVYRLKKTNPGVKGKPGSEYRLFTVALMLGNKFLDDNTYTNKTWAEVSGISVQEVHIMEVEFLSNMRYSLYTSEADWQHWQLALGKFGTYIDRASRSELYTRQNGPATPTSHKPISLPSPPTSMTASPNVTASYSPSHNMYANTPLLLPQVSSAAISPIGPLPELDLGLGSRKRSMDDNAGEPPAKRPAWNYPQQQAVPQQQPTPVTSASLMATGRVQHASGPRLPLPHLPSLSIPPSNSTPPSQPQLPTQLHPPTGRAMSTVYPPSSVPVMTPMSQPPMMQVSTPTRQLSPYPNVPSQGSSPVNVNFPPSSVLPQPQAQTRLSPSHFLAQRNSPYRPVRGVTTLLVPPPSGTFNPQPRSIGQDQMQYQPLGRPIQERRVGHLPYMTRDSWLEQYHGQPQPPQWSELPPLQQPTFRR